MDNTSFIFTHIPKCGGTSFRQYVAQCAQESGVEEDEMYIPGVHGLSNDKNIPQLNAEELLELQSRPLRVLACHCKYGVHSKYRLDSGRPFYYTILREPVERFMSHYNFFYYHLGYNNCKGVTINELPEDKLEFLLGSLANVMVHHLTDISAFRAIGYENIAKIAMFNLRYEYGCYGILEKMEESLEWLSRSCEVINFGGEIEFPFRNSFKKSDDRLIPSEDVTQKIRLFNQADLDLYDFALNNFTIK